MVTIVTTVLQGPESFFEDASQYDDQLMFDDMNLSRPILKVGPLLASQQEHLQLNEDIVQTCCSGVELRLVT